jgi:hypothetical protein
MATPRSIAELQRAGVVLRADEAVAIVQKLIHDRGHSVLVPPFGPPSIESVFVGDDGSVTCRACEATPGAAEIAILLQSFLPDGAPNVSGSLRYTIARALHDVDAPPFDSLDALSAALARHERGDRDRIVRALYARAAGAEHFEVKHERRRGRTPSDCRRHLREADERLYQQKLVIENAAAVRAAAPQRRVAPIVIAAAAAVLVIGGAEALRVTPSSAVATPPDAGPPASAQIPERSIEDRSAPTRPPAAMRTAHPSGRTSKPQPQQRAAHRGIADVFLRKVRIVDDFPKR